MVVFPNAKINIGLDILRRRPDGYHDIHSLMVPVDWRDVLEIVPSTANVTTLTVTGSKIECDTEKNLVMKAYRALSAEVGGLPAVDIYLRKIIPDGAGLGGGSSDAAFTLTALNSLFSLGLSDHTLASIAAKLGADCPFFIYNKPMMASGTGTELTPYTLPGEIYRMYLAIVKPPESVSTATAYAGVTPAEPAMKLPDALSLPVREWHNVVKNDFESSISDILPQVGEIRKQLRDMGAVYASMSGSGSAVYAFFESDILADDLSRTFPGYRTCLTSVIN